jgi:branched-chain amino acid transport system permease protein
MLSILLQLFISGIAMGFIYALVGIEYTLIWNSTGLLNFSHDKIIMLGAYVFAGTFVLDKGFNFVFSTIGTIFVLALFGVLISFVIFLPLRKMTRLCAIIGTVMLGKTINEAIRLLYGPAPLAVKNFFNGIIDFGSFVLPKANIFVIVVAILIVILLQLFMTKTKHGKAMLCVAENQVAAELMGINIHLNIVLTIAISFAICCMLGIMVTPIFSVEFSMATMIGLKGFAAGVVGGFGYLPGAIVGGLIIGIVENVGCVIFPSVYKDVVAFSLLIMFLLFKPSGILGKKL